MGGRNGVKSLFLVKHPGDVGSKTTCKFYLKQAESRVIFEEGSDK